MESDFLMSRFVPEFYGTPGLATAVPDFQGTDFLLNFVNNLNPNVFNKPEAAALSTTIFWPEYTTANRTLMTFLDGAVPLALSQDNFRTAPINFLAALTKQFPW
jgi:acetylcholinesterase